jgi:twitching motility protein PilJ
VSIADQFLQVSQNIDLVTENSSELMVVRESSDAIYKLSSDLLGELQALEDRFELIAEQANPLVTSIGAFMISFVFMVLMLMEFNKQNKKQLDDQERLRLVEEQQNQKNQNAILRLLDELSDLADGDLTIHTTVTEDFTGAIADSINFTIDQLRTLVSTINQTAVQVSSSAQETQSTAMHLAEASDHQAQEIAGASAAVNEMAVSIDQVSANAAESSAVAERSVTIAKKGSDVVKATIDGMATIREQIQETSKRIKRLGESSQEIGDIVSLITDIADQTNILALNAAIQASMAGDAGRGFAVVADEVQRLAERASAATKQIEGLVKTIQTDTSEAVISMEHTTAEVVRGARLAQDAGVALEEIETVSSNLADLIQNISNAAKQQASSAGQISNTMNVIQEITSQTSAGTSATANSIGNLAHLAVQMRNSVAGFKLPDTDDYADHAA